MIRKLQEADINKVADIWLDTNRKAHDFILGQYWKDNFETVKEMLPQAEVYVYEDENEIQGFIGLEDNYIEGIFVQSEAQSGGIGKALVDYVKDLKHQLNLRVYQKNTRAIKFYQREKFRIKCENTDENTGEKEWFMTWNRDICERFEFRNIRPGEGEQAAEIEKICFPPNEACSKKMMLERVAKAPELFLVAVERQTGKIAGFLNGLSTNENSFRDEFFTDAGLHDPDGKNIMLLGLDVLPDYRNQGLAREIMRRYLHREKQNGRHTVLLTCLESKVEMYKKMGFCDNGIANSTWGEEQWHEMSCKIH